MHKAEPKDTSACGSYGKAIRMRRIQQRCAERAKKVKVIRFCVFDFPQSVLLRCFASTLETRTQLRSASESGPRAFSRYSFVPEQGLERSIIQLDLRTDFPRAGEGSDRPRYICSIGEPPLCAVSRRFM